MLTGTGSRLLPRVDGRDHRDILRLRPLEANIHACPFAYQRSMRAANRILGTDPDALVYPFDHNPWIRSYRVRGYGNQRCALNHYMRVCIRMKHEDTRRHLPVQFCKILSGPACEKHKVVGLTQRSLAE